MPRLAHRPPLDFDFLLRFLGDRAVPGVEEVRDGAYRRVLRLSHGTGVVELRAADVDSGAEDARRRGAVPPRAERATAAEDARRRGAVKLRAERATAAGDAARPPLAVDCELWLDDERDRDAAIAASRALLDLDADPAAILAALGDDPLIGPLVRADPGRRVPGHPDPHELAVRAVLGQQVSVAAARTLAGRLAAAHGEPIDDPDGGGLTHAFPTAAALAAIDPTTLAMPRSRARALLALTAALAGGELVLEPRTDPAAADAALQALPGIGPWTASYVRMRALGDRDAFLPTDLGVRHALAALGAPADPGAAAATAERWRPWRSYALMHLWGRLAPRRPDVRADRGSA
jgi:AraC family transcriptional regulator, regulatory protein of adaptative response / DNA-3-methyladenine glycosylase II